MEKKVTVVTPDPLPDFLEWMYGADEMLVYSETPDEIQKAG